MTTHRRGGYALIYVLAALPLIVVIGHVSIEFTGSALRAQRFATEEAADDSARRLLVERMRSDARSASLLKESGESSNEQITFAISEGTISYRVSDRTVSRIMRQGENTVSETNWRFHHAQCTFQTETLDNNASIIWLRFDASFQFRKNLPSSRAYATALRVGNGGKSR